MCTVCHPLAITKFPSKLATVSQRYHPINSNTLKNFDLIAYIIRISIYIQKKIYFGKCDYTHEFGENFNDESKYVFLSLFVIYLAFRL